MSDRNKEATNRVTKILGGFPDAVVDVRTSVPVPSVGVANLGREVIEKVLDRGEVGERSIASEGGLVVQTGRGPDGEDVVVHHKSAEGTFVVRAYPGEPDAHY